MPKFCAYAVSAYLKKNGGRMFCGNLFVKLFGSSRLLFAQVNKYNKIFKIDKPFV